MADDAGGSAPARATRLLPAGPSAAGAGARTLAAGGLVAFATETVYGLGADAASASAVAALYAAKERPSFNPLIAHVPDLAAAEREGVFDADARALAQAFWPGPLTLVTPVANTGSVCLLARAGLDSVALRAPDYADAQALLRAFARPVVAPSANRSGRLSPTQARHVMADLEGRCDLVIDSGPTRVGLESTIVACLGGAPTLLRPGGVARQDIERVLARPLADVASIAGDPHAPRAPGMLSSHYAPRARLRLDAHDVANIEAVLDFAGALRHQRERAKAYVDLSPSGDLAQAAAHLFAALRTLDASGADMIAVAPMPRTGLGEAIADRLMRAAAPRA